MAGGEPESEIRSGPVLHPETTMQYNRGIIKIQGSLFLICILCVAATDYAIQCNFIIKK